MESQDILLTNHTPHNVVIQTVDKDGLPGLTTIYPTQPTLRLGQEEADILGCGRVTVSPCGETTRFVPPPRYTGLEPVGFSALQGSDIIVSQLVAQWLVDHPRAAGVMGIGRVYVPDTSPASAVRNERGEITAVKQLVRYL